MPSLQEAIHADRSNLTPIDPAPRASSPPSMEQQVRSLLKSPYQRCPLPPSNNSADSLRQSGQGTNVPMFRTQSPPSNLTTSTQGSATSKISSGVVSGSSSSTTTIVNLTTAKNVNLQTPSLSPSQTWEGTIQMAKGFAVLAASANSFCRVELYGTALAQALDLSRPVTQAPSNTTQGLILDLAFLGALSWQVLDCVGANGDSPQGSVIYVTITNLSTAARAFSVSIQFVPNES